MKFLLSFILRLLTGVLKGGWLIPLWLAGNEIFSWRIALEMRRIDSFPHLQFAQYMFGIAMLWCLAVKIVCATGQSANRVGADAVSKKTERE